tara:strand:+ start:1506 stop:3437 length:1932 start_codon:yes stop_codon:yes gene_type:complete
MVSTSLLTLASPALAASSITFLDPLTPGQPTIALDINGDGSIVVGSSNDKAVYWTSDGVAHDIGIAFGDSSIAAAISPDGTYAVGYTTIGMANVSAWAYEFAGSYTVLPMTIFGGATTIAAAFGVNSDGSVIVGVQSDGMNTYGVVWSGVNWNTETSIGSLRGAGFPSAARGVSGDGTIVVGDSESNNAVTRPIYWTAGGGMHELSPGANYVGSATAISSDGSTIVGVNYIGGGVAHAFSWTGVDYATETDLGSLGGGIAVANAVSADGSIIVGATTASDASARAFRYADGTMSDINTLLSETGVDMTGIVFQTALAVSADGNYILAETNTSIDHYLVYYDGATGGVSTSSAQQASVDELGETRQSLGVQQDAFTGMMIGDLSPNTQNSEVGAFGLYGSVAGGIAGQFKVADNMVLSGGILGGRGDYDALDYKGVMMSMALRYDFAEVAPGLKPFAQIGGAFVQLSDLTFRRTYANGGGTATGVGSTSGRSYLLFARAGVTSTLGENDQLAFAAEIGERWLSTDAYAESLVGNPFPAVVEAGTDRQTVAKLSAALTHNFTSKFDVTLRAAVGEIVEGTSGLRVAVTGFGAAQSSIDRKPWLEGGVRMGWKASDAVTFNVYATGMSGDTVKTSGHVGLGAQFSF